MESEDKLRSITEKYGNPFAETVFPKDSSIALVLEGFEEEKEICSAGRVVTKREHGKSGFAHIQDSTGKIQIYVRLNDLGEDDFNLFKQLDLGDVVGVKGTLFRTKTGEPTIWVKGGLKLLAKCLRPLPEKWHGLKEVEVKYRQRYLDLISSPQARDVFRKRSEIIQFIRDFFNKKAYIEVETPMLQLIPGGAKGNPFLTHYNAISSDVYMRIAPELFLKRLLVGGFDRVYEINKCFRNEGLSTRHSPEFTMLEAYASYRNYEYMMKICEELIFSLVLKIHGKPSFEYQGTSVDFSPPWERISFAGLFREEFGVTESDSSEDVLGKITKKLNLSVKELSRTQILNITEELIEKRFPQARPVFVTDFFSWMSPLSKRSKNSPGIVERFELFVAGLEIANSYSELNDPVEQGERFRQQLSLDEEMPKKIDEDFLLSLQYGMPPAAGLGIGIDRLIMVLLNQPCIRDVILFPLLKPL